MTDLSTDWNLLMTSNGSGKSRVPGSSPGEPNRIWVALMSAAFEILPAAAFALIGIVSLVTGGTLVPGTMEIMERLFSINWQVAMGLGGVLTVLGRVNDWDRIEQSGLAMMGYSFGLYFVVLTATAIFVTHSLTAITVIGLCASLAGACGIRLYVLRMSRKARVVAGQVLFDRKQNGDSPS